MTDENKTEKPAEKAKDAPKPMKAYKVDGGIVRLGVAYMVELTADQYLPRAAKVEVIEKTNGGGYVCKTVEPIEFKNGEVIKLPGVPKESANYLVKA